MSAARSLPDPPDPNAIDHFVYRRGRWQDYESLPALRALRTALATRR